MGRPIALALALLVLGGCAQLQTAFGAFRGGVSVVKEVRYKAANAAEAVRCRRTLDLVMRMADERGPEWLDAYVASCRNMQTLIRRIAGSVALNQGFRLTAPVAPNWSPGFALPPR